jgi:uncharacterized protein YggE
MKKWMIVALLCVATAGFSQTGEKNFIDRNYMEVTGKAELEIVPDMIYVKITLGDKDHKEKLTLAEQEKRMTEKMTEVGIDTHRDLTVMDFASNLKSTLFKSDVALTKQYQLLVRDAKTLQRVFFEFQKMGISRVSIEKLEHSKIEQHRKDVKVTAVKAAKEKAERLAEALGQTIGKALYVQETDFMNPHSVSNALYGRAPGVNLKIRGLSSNLDLFPSDETETVVEFEKIRVESTFLVRFELL